MKRAKKGGQHTLKGSGVTLADGLQVLPDSGFTLFVAHVFSQTASLINLPSRVLSWSVSEGLYVRDREIKCQSKG